MPKKMDNILAQLRRNSIEEMVSEKGSVTVTELCEKFNVTSATIRSDLTKLESAGRLERTYGGAVCVGEKVYDPSLYVREELHILEKQAIAHTAVQSICPNDVIGLDSGSTTYQLCKLLGEIGQLTVVTYDLRIATWLEYNTSANVIMAGGSINRNYHCTCGQIARETLSMLNINRLFLSANGVSIEQGLSTAALDMAEIKSTMIKSAESVSLLCDSSKMNRKAIVSFAPLSMVDELITDSGITPAFAQQVKDVGVRVKVAQPKS